MQNITNPIESPFCEVRRLLSDSLQHENPLLNLALTNVKARGGKMMRPILVLLSAQLVGKINECTKLAAVSYELFHTASLVHDDVVDESTERRGQESINSAFDNKVAVLVGDSILSIALRLLSETNNALIHTLSSAVLDLTDGELLQLHNTQRADISEERYYKIIQAKTASLFAACAESGALSVGATADDVRRLHELGNSIGMSFQIRDDIFDYNSDDIGKPTGNDMKEGKLTLPAIYVLKKLTAGTDEKGENVDGMQKNVDEKVENIDEMQKNTDEMQKNSKGIGESLDELVKNIKNGKASDEEIATMIRLSKDCGGIDYATKVMNSWADRARDILNHYPDSPTRQALHAYIDYVVGRTF